MLDFSLTLETDKVLLRPLISEDYNCFEDITADESMWIHFTSDLSVKSELHKWIETALADIKNRARLVFTIIEKISGKAVGSTSLGNISYIDRRIEIGWTWICKSCQGTGINQQAKYLLMKYIFETLNFERVELKTDVLNIAARKAIVHIGAREEGILRSHTLMTHGRRRDTIYYSILISEWPEIKRKNYWK